MPEKAEQGMVYDRDSRAAVALYEDQAKVRNVTQWLIGILKCSYVRREDKFGTNKLLNKSFGSGPLTVRSL